MAGPISPASFVFCAGHDPFGEPKQGMTRFDELKMNCRYRWVASPR